MEARSRRMKYTGVVTIARLNWPWYAAGVAMAIIVLVLLDSANFDRLWWAIAIVGIVAGGVWMLVSLLVSHYVYDRSAIARGGWLDDIDPAGVRRAVIYHAGQDEASAVVARVLD